MRELTGLIFRIHSTTTAWLIEVDNTPDDSYYHDLADFVAGKTAEGHIITAVTEVHIHDRATPRISVMKRPEYKESLTRYTAKYDPPKTIAELEKRIERKGWACDSEKSIDGYNFEIGHFSPDGEDFYLTFSGETLDEVMDDFKDAAENFDEEEHVKTMMNANGAPGLADLVKDAADIHTMLRDLLYDVTHPVMDQ